MLTKVCIVKAMDFPVVMYWCENWTIKKGWAPKNWCLWTVVWRRLLRVPWTARRSNQSILKDINPKYYLEGLMLQLKLWYLATWCEDPTHWKSFPDAGKDWAQEEKWATRDEMVGWQHQLNGHEFEQTLGNRGAQGSLACCSPWGHKEMDMTERLNKPSIQEVPHR